MIVPEFMKRSLGDNLCHMINEVTWLQNSLELFTLFLTIPHKLHSRQWRYNICLNNRNVEPTQSINQWSARKDSIMSRERNKWNSFEVSGRKNEKILNIWIKTWTEEVCVVDKYKFKPAFFGTKENLKNPMNKES